MCNCAGLFPVQDILPMKLQSRGVGHKNNLPTAKRHLNTNLEGLTVKKVFPFPIRRPVGCSHSDISYPEFMVWNKLPSATRKTGSHTIFKATLGFLWMSSHVWRVCADVAWRQPVANTHCRVCRCVFEDRPVLRSQFERSLCNQTSRDSSQC